MDFVSFFAALLAVLVVGASFSVRGQAGTAGAGAGRGDRGMTPGAVPSPGAAVFGVLSDGLVVEAAEPGAFAVVGGVGRAATLWCDGGDWKGVVRAVGDLAADVERVTGVKPEVVSGGVPKGNPVIIGTLGKNGVIDKLVEAGTLKAGDLKGKWESFVITTAANPVPGVEQALVIAGSDKRGTIFGVYELSRQLGVSPWYWWADVPATRRGAAYVKGGYYASGEPKVKYRGIFINDENPCMQTWAREKFGGMNSKMYTHMFELLLRLRANCLWPGMWGSQKEDDPGKPILKDAAGNWEGNSFNEDDPENPRLADEYGIVMGTSHHEPMQRSQQEWLRNKEKYGNGQWNYVSNKDGIQKFFREGIEHTKNFESLVTIGMRGDDDKPMADAGSAEANFRVLEGIMGDQRRIIQEAKPTAPLQQIWTLYSEVLDFYDKGMNVPENVIIVLCDNNWGDVRRLPELNGKKHPGGYGMYYHVAYYGGPRANKWLNMTQISHMWEQLQMTYDYGVDKIWILNVGDLKPAEYPMSFFLDMAWNPKDFNEKNLRQYTERFCAQQFGPVAAAEAASILDTYCKYASRQFAEALDDKTYNLANGEFKTVTDEFLALEARALRQFLTMPEPARDAYKELVLFPVQAMANLYDLYYAVAMNRKLAAEKDAAANAWADRAEACFKRDAELCADYNKKVAGGKWNHMMDQTHIGFTTWHPPKGGNVMPRVVRVAPGEAKRGGYVFSEKNGVVVMEAEHFFAERAADKTAWTVIPDLGRTLSGVALMPYTQAVEGAALTYKMKLNGKPERCKIRMVFRCTMPFKEGGHRVAGSVNGGEEKTITLNDQLIWKNVYTRMYPAGASRIIELEMELRPGESRDGTHSLVLRPLDPGIVFEKVIVDCGGYEGSHLKMLESPYSR